MKRRHMVAALGGALTAWPLAGRGQSGPLPTVGFFFSEKREAAQFRLDAVRRGLKEFGFIDGQNVAIEARWGDGDRERLPALARELVERKVAVICAGNVNCALAAKQATATIPIVFLTAGDPVADGLVASFNRPGGNATGVHIFSAGLAAKRLQILHELMPNARRIGFLINPANPTADGQVRSVEEAARSSGLGLLVVRANTPPALDQTFETLTREKVDALAVGADPFFNARTEQMVGLAARHRLPAIYEWRESAAAGGLISYGTSLADAFVNLGLYCGRILKGEKPQELPVMQQTKFELVINLRTAQALQLKVPPLLQAKADETIE